MEQKHSLNCDCANCFNPLNRVYREERTKSFRRRKTLNKRAKGYRLRKGRS